MADKHYAQSPLLYVEQPGISKPKARMQQRYQSSTKPKGPQISQESGTTPEKKSKKRSTTRWSLQSEPDHYDANKHEVDVHGAKETPEADDIQAIEAIRSKDEVQPVEENVETDHTQDKEDAKPFKQMTIDEKVAYLTNRSAHAPLLRCEVKTSERSYRGIVMETNEQEIFMRVGRRTSATAIALTDIEDIRLLGLV